MHALCCTEFGYWRAVLLARYLVPMTVIIRVYIQSGPEKTARSLLLQNIATVSHSFARLSPNIQKLIRYTKTEKILILRFNILGLN